MTVGDLFWVFFMLSTLQPVLRQRLLDGARQRLIARIERRRRSRVILLMHWDRSIHSSVSIPPRHCSRCSPGSRSPRSTIRR